MKAGQSVRQLLLLSWPLLAVIGCLLLLAAVGMSAMSTARAYASGEAFWSKAQKAAVLHLARFAQTGSEADYLDYLESIAVNFGDRKARLALDRPDPDLKAAFEGFREGRNHPDDIPSMIRMLRYFRFDPLIEHAIGVWARGDAQIERLHERAQALRDEVMARGPNSAATRALMGEIARIDAELTPLEDEFAITLGAASRRIALVLGGAGLLISIALIVAGLLISSRALARLRSAQSQFSLVSDNVQTMVAEYDREWRLQRFNRRLPRVFGIENPNPVGMSLREIVGEEVFRRVEPYFQRAYAGEVVRYEREFHPASGPPGYLSVTLAPSFDADGNIDRLFAFMDDTTERKRAEQALSASEARKAAVIDLALDCVISIDRQSRVLEFNPAAEATFGYTRAQAIGRDLADLIIPPTLRQAHRDGMARYLSTGQASVLGRRLELRAMRADGQEFPVELSIAPIKLGAETTFTAYLRDITGRKNAEQAAAQHALRQGILARFGQFALAHADLETLFREAASEAARGLGIEYCGVLQLAGEENRLLLRAQFGSRRSRVGRITFPVEEHSPAGQCLATGESILVNDFDDDRRFRTPSLDREPDALSGAAVAIRGAEAPYGVLYAQSVIAKRFGGAEIGFLETIANILSAAVERSEAVHRMAHFAQFDSLTGLPNRNLFRDRLGHAISRAHREKHLVALVFLDLDRFKEINDTLGHEAGDQVLREVGARLRRTLREGDTLARLGGDEFTVILEDLESTERVRGVAQKLHRAFAEPVRLEGRDLFISPSMGIALYPSDGADADTLLKHADIAMYHAKSEGRDNFQFYTATMSTAASERVTLEAALRHALEREEFLLHYQPVIDLKSGEISSVEVLLRWQHPEWGLTTPDRFIGVAEQTGLIVPVGEWVLREASAKLVRWRESGVPIVPVAVNLSARQFRRSDLAAVVREALRASGLEPGLLELEITESLLMENPSVSGKLLGALNEMGVRIALDDFGTGYSSLSYLKHFPLNVLKIDRSFVRDIPGDPDDVAIVRATIGLAHSLELEVTAEGVETPSQAAFLREHGCDRVQGYLYSRPVPADTFAAMLRNPARLRAQA